MIEINKKENSIITYSEKSFYRDIEEVGQGLGGSCRRRVKSLVGGFGIRTVQTFKIAYTFLGFGI